MPTTSAHQTRNLTITPEVRRQLEQTYANFVAGHIPFPVGFIGGEVPGGTFYGFDGPTSTYWAATYFKPSQAAIDRYHELPANSDLNPLIWFQDGPYTFARPAGGSWNYVGESWPVLCSPPIPRALLDLWALTPVPHQSVNPPLNRYCVYYPRL